MEKTEDINEYKTAIDEAVSFDMESLEYGYSDSQEDEHDFIPVVDMDQYIGALNDWD